MRPRTRDKKLHEEWVVPLNNIDDICEVCFSDGICLNPTFYMLLASQLILVLMKL